MASTLQHPRAGKKHKNDKKPKKMSKDMMLQGSPVGGENSRKRKQQPCLSEMTPLYIMDLGLEGVKKTSHHGPILSGPEKQKFTLRETADEKVRRMRRKARFGSEAVGSSVNHSVAQASASQEPVGLSRPLSSGRKEDHKSWMLKSNKNNTIGAVGSHGKFVGTSQQLEKSYLRLTTYPKAELVRPLEVLVKSLAHIKNKYYQEEDFDWANEQLKSVRQDITVQRLRNRFVLDVYETHARILLEHGDLSEFNQCQTMIRCLTTTGGLDASDSSMNGDLTDSEMDALENGEKDVDLDLAQSEEAADEFRAYHLLYALVQNSWDDLTKALVRSRRVSREDDDNCCCKTGSSRHALQVVKAVIHNDYRAFFKLYESAPHMSAYLMDFLVKRMRDKAYERIISAYRPTISVEHFREALCFKDLEETRLFLRENSAVFVAAQKGEPPFYVDCKASSTTIAQPNV